MLCRLQAAQPEAQGVPPLPEQAATTVGLGRVYTAEQMHAYAQAYGDARAAAERERCIRACQAEQLEDEPDTEGDFAYMHAVCDCIAAIRATTQEGKQP